MACRVERDEEDIARYSTWPRSPAWRMRSKLLESACGRGPSEFQPPVTQARAERRARCLGFVMVSAWSLPDGRAMRLYQRTVPLPAPDASVPEPVPCVT